MSEICNNCGHDERWHGPYCKAMVDGNNPAGYCDCEDFTFTARPDEPKGDKCGICLSSPAEADRCCSECRAVSEPALLRWQNHEDGQTIARLTAELQAERAKPLQFNDAIPAMKEAYKEGVKDGRLQLEADLQAERTRREEFTSEIIAIAGKLLRYTGDKTYINQPDKQALRFSAARLRFIADSLKVAQDSSSTSESELGQSADQTGE